MFVNALPKVKLGNSDIEVTRFISGGNPLCGNSHFTPELSQDMREYFTDKQVVEFLHEVQRQGINTLQARGDFHRILYWRELFRREGGQLHFIVQTASEMFDIFENIRVIAATGAQAIYHHGTRTDNFWLDGKIDEVEDYLKCMRDTGVQVGIASHIPEVLHYVEDKGWDVDFYMTCFYNLNKSKRESTLVDPFNKGTFEEFHPEDPPKMIEFINRTDKQCIAFKFLAANRQCRTQADVRAAFEHVFANIKPDDITLAGMFPKYEEQIALNVEHTLAAIAKVESGETTAAADD
jgi:hypothetical protein